MAHGCRHYLGMRFDGQKSCALGWDVRQRAVENNGGSEFGIGLRLPCTKPNSETPLFECADLDRKSDEEVEAGRASMKDRMDRIVQALPKVQKMKRKMVANGLKSAKATCPWCDEKDGLSLSCAVDYNQHVRVHCRACGEGFME